MARRSGTAAVRDEVRGRLDAMQRVAARFQGWQPAGKVLTRVMAQPTIFPQLDCATRVGGWPLQRIAMVHGPSGHGKTSVALGLGLSFLQAGHFFAYVDAEFTTPTEWLQGLMAEHAGNPGFLAQRPRSYEETVKAVRELCDGLVAARDAGDVPPETTALIVVDSLRKLVPAKLLDKMLTGKDGVDGAKGRAAMMKAALNAQWLDELVPMLYHSNATMVLIAREFDNPDANPWEADYKVAGGKAVLFDSSLAMRVTRGWVRRGSGEDSEILGERHKVSIHKTKVGGKEDKVEVAYYHTSNGVLVPEGFDRPRDVVELACERGVVEKGKGAWLTHSSTGERWQGEHQAVKALHADPKLAAELEAEVRATFGRQA
jgi:RecA/RadA recombinase